MIEFLHIGKIFKTHGIKGEVEVEIDEVFEDWLLKEKVFFLQIEGNFVPFWIESYRSDARLFIKIEEINSPEQAKIITHKEILLDKSRIPKSLMKNFQDELTNNSFESFTIHDIASNTTAIIEKVIEYPSQLMLELSLNDKTLMVPLHKDFIQNIDEAKKIITVKFPEGIFEI
ncbi:MAG: 16S rRNA processing protein RimM [Saprospiraceae bacterium]|nr:16S rRNA processing protein RimM [Saprospiraceae bacterium]